MNLLLLIDHYLLFVYAWLHSLSFQPFLEKELGTGWEIGVIVVFPAMTAFLLFWGMRVYLHSRKHGVGIVEAMASVFMSQGQG